jgi:RNA methyltransferase, TrmH family
MITGLTGEKEGRERVNPSFLLRPSKEHPIIREIMEIKKGKAEKPLETRIIEGAKICREALQSGILPEMLLFSETAAAKNLVSCDDLVQRAKETLVLPDHVFRKISVSKAPQGIAAVVNFPVTLFQREMEPNPDSVYMVCDAIQDPGNVGNMIRIADAFALEGVIFNAKTAHPSNDKVIRSSMGSVFRVRLIFTRSIAETLDDLTSLGVIVYGTHLEGKEICSEFRFRRPCAIVFGNEGQGLSPETLEKCTEKIRIPMPGKAQSLNVSNAAAITAFIASKGVHPLAIS